MNGHNLSTADEAKKKWCPLARSLGTLIQPAQPGGPEHVVATGGQNRGYQMGGALHNCMCIAAECMAWRKVDQIGITPEGKKVDRDMDGRVRWVDRGYCGAFGSPVLLQDRGTQ